MVGLTVLAMVGGGDSALAKELRPGNGDKATFKSSCDQHGGTFIDSPSDKLTICVWGDGSKTVCDANGNDCINYPPPPKKQTDSGMDVADAPLIVDDTQIVTPVDAPLEAIAEAPAIVEAPVEAIVEAPLEVIAEAPVEAPVTLTEEPMVVASEEQP